MDFGTYVRVRSIFFGVSVVFAYMSTHYALGGDAGLLVPSSLLIRGAPVAPRLQDVALPGSLGGIPTPVGVGIPQARP